MGRLTQILGIMDAKNKIPVRKIHKVAGGTLPSEKLTLDKIIGDSLIMTHYSIGSRSVKIPIKTSAYLKYKTMTHSRKRISDFVSYVTFEDPTIVKCAQYLTEGLNSKEEKAELLLKFTHQHMYDVRIEKGRDYVRYPLEMMVDRNGDCKDFSILGAAVMKAVGIDVAFAYIHQAKKGEAAHLGLAVKGDFSGKYFDVEGEKYYYAEATGNKWMSKPSKWEIGDMPLKFQDRKIDLFLID